MERNRKLNTLSQYLLMVLLLFTGLNAGAQEQNTDTKFRMPLKDAIHMLEERFQIEIRFDDHLVDGVELDYAPWRLRADRDQSLANVFSPLDLKVQKVSENKYKLKEYEYFRWEVQEAWDYLDYLAGKYHDKESWLLRKDSIRTDLMKALKLDPLPEYGNRKPIRTKKRNHGDYTVENFALEIMPGLFINGSIYRPKKVSGKIPLMLSPDGHWGGHRFRKDAQIRNAMIAKMGAVSVSYDLFAWGESLLQFNSEDHRRPLALTVQTLSALRILDMMLEEKQIDPNRVGISGGSGGGNHAVLVTAIDGRIKLSIPVASLSSYHFGGCPCESGFPIHFSANGTNNVEIAAMTAPRPQLLISDGGDWTAHMPEHDFPYLKNVYRYFGAESELENVHLPDDAHDFGYSKRKPVYTFLIKHFGLNSGKYLTSDGEFEESSCVIEEEEDMYAFGENGERLPENAIIGYEELEKLFKQY